MSDGKGPKISIHAPRTGSDVVLLLSFQGKINFNPRSPHGERQACQRHMLRHCHFNPCSPHGERPRTAWRTPPRFLFQPTLPARGATVATRWQASLRVHFNPRSPHGERHISFFIICQAVSTFQPTLPARGATAAKIAAVNPAEISTHAPRTGSDRISSPSAPTSSLFQPTLPARGATFVAILRERGNLISTHAPRTGSDVPANVSSGGAQGFQPTLPHGERHHHLLDD